MPREMVALVSADDVIAAVRVHADRVHDLLRRSGSGAEETLDVLESYALALVDALVNAPETVGDMAGWWFGRALELGRRLGDTGAVPADEQPTSVLAGTAAEAAVRGALATLPESERAAVMLRDAYDLPPEAVAVALRRDVNAAAQLVAVGRLHLVAEYDRRPPPQLPPHSARSTIDLAMLGRLADGTLPPPRTAPLRRHVSACTGCEDVLDALARGRRLAAGLPVLAMPDEAREALIATVSARARQVLPTVDDVLLAIEDDDDTRPLVAPLLVVGAIALALVLGVAVAAATRSHTASNGLGAAPVPTVAPTVQPSFTVSAGPSATPSATASATPTHSLTPSASATPSATTSASASATSRPRRPRIALSPASGPRGTTVTVTGSNWPAGTPVDVSYVGPISSSKSSTTADDTGHFTVTVQADGLVPGDYTVRAQGGGRTVSATFTQTS